MPCCNWSALYRDTTAVFTTYNEKKMAMEVNKYKVVEIYQGRSSSGLTSYVLLAEDNWPTFHKRKRFSDSTLIQGQPTSNAAMPYLWCNTAVSGHSDFELKLVIDWHKKKSLFVDSLQQARSATLSKYIRRELKEKHALVWTSLGDGSHH